MKWSNYSNLKSAGKASITKESDLYYINQKSYDGRTGEELDDIKRETSLASLESKKASYDSDVASAQAASDELAKMITDLKAL